MTDNLKLKQSNIVQILFCKECGWESPDSNIGMKPVCPECNEGLYVRKEDISKS